MFENAKVCMSECKGSCKKIGENKFSCLCPPNLSPVYYPLYPVIRLGKGTPWTHVQKNKDKYFKECFVKYQ